MKRGDSHSSSKCFVYGDFSGGENYLDPPSQLKPNEVALAKNLEFDRGTGLLQVRPGLRQLNTLTLGPGSPRTTAFFTSTGIELRAHNRNLYRVERNLKYNIDNPNYPVYNPKNLGHLSGVYTPMFCEWDGKVLIASGGVLQCYDPAKGLLANIDISNVKSANGDELYSKLTNVDIVFTIGGRVVVSQSGADTLFYSAIGDETTWHIDSGDTSKGQAIDIGYKDGGDITAVVPMGKDLIVFKTSGIFRVTGFAPNWSVYELSRTYRTVNRFSAIQLGNDCLFIDPSEGVCRLSSVETYGDLKVSDYAGKINSGLKGVLTSESYLVHVRKRGQVMVVSPPQNTVYVLHYGVGNGAWTHYKFAFPAHAGAAVSFSSIGYDDHFGNVFVFGSYRGAKDPAVLFGVDYLLDASVTTDGGAPMSVELTLRQFDLEYGSLLKKAELVIIPRSGCGGHVDSSPEAGVPSRLSFLHNISGGGGATAPTDYVKAVALAEQTGCYALDLALSPLDAKSYVERNVLRARAVTPMLSVDYGRLVVKELRFWIAEV